MKLVAPDVDVKLIVFDIVDPLWNTWKFLPVFVESMELHGRAYCMPNPRSTATSAPLESVKVYLIPSSTLHSFERAHSRGFA